ncbi:MAG: 16S rRNA (cytosine(1402)-N(4))-methyltransferase RsmH [bacterium]|jgi:16S rRNA (cytosine1402-N4)-methyltransferase
MGFIHQPVLLSEVLTYLVSQPEGVYIDCTLGGGGHAEAVLKQLSPAGRFLGIDQDEIALAAATRRLQPYKNQLKLARGNFSQLEEIWQRSGLPAPCGILFDLGVSSPQLDEKERGFSYQEDAPLDMRMDRQQPFNAAKLVNTWPEKDIAHIIRQYGEERWAARIASFIVQRRRERPLTTTGQLVDVIKAAIPAAARRRGPHPARRTFQALRIAVNDELEVLPLGLEAAAHIIAPGGRIVAISFHSLEDRIVKHTFRRLAMEGKFTVLTKKPVIPSSNEAENNPRARSSKLRAVMKRA